MFEGHGYTSAIDAQAWPTRVHRTDCSTSFRDDMGDHPITSDTWSAYQIQAPIDQDARDIEFGMQLVGSGTAWIDRISLEFTDAE